MNGKKVLILCIAIAVTACLVSGMFVYYYMKSQVSGSDIRVGTGSYQDLQKYLELSDLEGLIRNYYYQTPDDTSMTAGALKGMVKSLGDPYSAYYTEDEYKDYKQGTDGVLVGISAVVGPYQNSGELKVEKVYSGGPAETAGLLEGDVILAIDGATLRDLDYDGAVNLLQGPSGSTVELTVQSGNDTKVVSVARADVKTQYVSYTSLDDDIGFITINEFKGECVKEFQDALKFLKDEDLKGVVIDIRGNLGGNMKDAITIADEIVPEGLITYTLDKNSSKQDYKADSKYNSIPLSVLVDGNTTSAAEMFAGAVQDSGRGRIIGTQTYGKGVAQTVYDMPYSGGGVKLTTAEYYTPKGAKINGVGITPDEVVELPNTGEPLTVETDSQLQAGIAAVKAQL